MKKLSRRDKIFGTLMFLVVLIVPGFFEDQGRTKPPIKRLETVAEAKQRRDEAFKLFCLPPEMARPAR